MKNRSKTKILAVMCAAVCMMSLSLGAGAEKPNDAAGRHNVFNYRNIAEYYAHAKPEMQRLMEKSALVIIDVDNAIANGYASLFADVLDTMEDEDDA